MFLLPYTCSVSRGITGKTVYCIRLLQEGDHAWQETDVAAALEENGLIAEGSPCVSDLEGQACALVAIDAERTDLSRMYSAEELDAGDTETHRWCTYRLITNTVDNSVWLPPPADAAIAPFSLLGVLRHILKARGVELLNGGCTS